MSLKGIGNMTTRIGQWMMVLLLLGCASAKPNVDDPTTPAKAMSVEEARKVVTDFAASLGNRVESPAPPPTSVADVVAIFKNDDIFRFDQAIEYLNGVQGLESLAMRAAFEAYRGGMQIGVADFFIASVKKLEAESAQLEGKKERGVALSNDEQDKLAALKSQAAQQRRVSDALRVLAGTSLETAARLAGDLISQYPDQPEGYQTMARVHQLRGQWKLFDEKIAQAERLLAGKPSFSVQYQRAFEAWRRNASEDEARALMVKLREALPDYVRIQAALVLLQPDIASRYQELQKLKELCPHHLLVLLAEPSIRKEYETASAIREALAPAAVPEAGETPVGDEGDSTSAASEE